MADNEKTIGELKKRITELESKLTESNSKLENLAITDPLTDLLNDRGINMAFMQESAISRRNNSHFSAMLAVVNNYSELSKVHGVEGSAVMEKEIAQKLRSTLRATDYISRIDEGNFLVLLPNTRLAEGMKTAEKIRAATTNCNVTLLSGKSITASVSMSVIRVSQDISSVEELMNRAKLVLSKGSTTVSESTQNIHSEDSVSPEELSNVLKKLTSGECINAVLQPIFDITSNTKTGYELLCRTDIKGFEMPADFFPLCFETRVASLVDFICFKKSMFKSIPIFPTMSRHINIFPSTLIEVPLRRILREFPNYVPKETYCLEMSEQYIMGDPSYLLEPVQELKKQGVKIGLDDVGFGNSSLESLILLEPDVIKIDKSYVIGISKDPSRERLVRRLIKVTQSLGSEVIVAEGVENEYDLKLLKALGVKYVQGFLFGKPGPL